MTFGASLAIGEAPVEDLEHLCDKRRGTDRITLVRSEGVAVAWATDCPWIQTADDGERLIVLDGRLHNVAFSLKEQAQWLLARYRERGVELARGLLGDFVLIVVDREKGRTVVARDPLGVRPWYQAGAGSRQAGASNLATLVDMPWIDTALNERIAIEYLACVEESRGETLYRGIRTLRPGQTWSYERERSATFTHHQWNLEPDLKIGWDEAAERCREVLAQAVACRLAGAGSTTSELSGGLDSSTIVGTVMQLGLDDLLVGRLLFDTPRADERFYSDAVIDHWSIAALSTPPWVPTRDDRHELTERLRRPAPDANFTMFASLHRGLLEMGRRDGLTGLGGDDAFIAMAVPPRLISAVQLRQPDVLRAVARSGGRGFRPQWREIVRPTLGYFLPARRGRGIPRWVSARAVREGDLRVRFKRRAQRVTGIRAIDERISPLLSGYNAAILETRAAMTDWIGWRESHPFLDPRFISCTYGLDPSWPTVGGHNRALEVAAFRDRLPGAVVERRSKADFSEVFWPQILEDATIRRLRGGPLWDEGWLDPEGLDALLDDAKRGMAPAAIPLYRCIALDEWIRAEQYG